MEAHFSSVYETTRDIQARGKNHSALLRRRRTCHCNRKRRPRLLSRKSAFTQTASAEMNRVLVCVLTAALSLGNGEQTVHQPAGDVHAVEGATVTLGCSFSRTGSNDYIFWYKQEVNAAPEFVLSIFKIGQGKTEKKYANRFRASMDSNALQAPLHIESVKLSDSAVYYCALQPTLTHPLACLHKNTCTRLVPRHIGGVVSRESTVQKEDLDSWANRPKNGLCNSLKTEIKFCIRILFLATP
ncbi:uncharacterized protein LOC133471813 [Phyllopteryx taeniolatus]|uniref:uncharacterized protein LOC133471813 n=1 Tax=Phyllopteryx taeniolatus TaxID=161469 RepID=UPI002AD2A14E|nr:uncharacterized protein LOC133471813 [Phyllopteryx taeniolatus]